MLAKTEPPADLSLARAKIAGGRAGGVGNLARAKGEIAVIPAAGGPWQSEMAQFTSIIENLARPKKGRCVTSAAGGAEVAHFWRAKVVQFSQALKGA